MLLKLAWRNLWRNKRRSLIVLISIIVGVAILLINEGFTNGLVYSMLSNQVKTHTSHIQIHANGFNSDKQIESILPDQRKVLNEIEKQEFVKKYSKRVVAFGLLTSPSGSAGCALTGVEHDKESNITNISERIVEGAYLTGKTKEIVIGKKMAEKLDVKIGSKVVLVSNSYEGIVENRLFRISGIYKSSNSNHDKMYIYVNLKDSQDMLALGNNINELAIITDNTENVYVYKESLINTLNDKAYEVLSFEDLNPMIMAYIGSYKQMIYVMYMIFVIAALFGIINTMLMSVFERVQEIGILMSLGMKKSKIFMMIIQEALVLGGFGTAVGFISGMLVVLVLSSTGIDFSLFSDGLSNFGLDSTVYPILKVQTILNSLLIMPFATVLGAVYPAYKAIKLLPTDAMRYVG